MKSLTSSSSLTSNKSHPCFSSSVKFLPINHQVISFPLTKLPYLHFISFQPIHHLLPLHSPSFPPHCQTDLELAETLHHESYESKMVHVKFQLQKECSFGEQFAIVGDDPNFGSWDPDNAISLNWSDDHVWSLELDVPIGISINFKFILKQISGSILWQPGPDRILKTWETMNTIVVCEDWEDATLQKLLEEEVISSENVDPAVNEEKVASNPQKAVLKTEMSGIVGLLEEKVMYVVGDNISNSKEEPAVIQNHQVLKEGHEEVISSENVDPAVNEEKVASNPQKAVLKTEMSGIVGLLEEKVMYVVGDNISNSKEEPAVIQNHQVLKEGHEGDLDEVPLAFEKILQDNGRTNLNVGEDVMIEEGNPVLVPGLPPEPVNYNETEIHDERDKSTIAFDGSVELEENHNVDVDRNESEMIEVFSDMEQQLQNEQEGSEENQQIPNKVVENDIRWGRRTLQRLLTNFGLL